MTHGREGGFRKVKATEARMFGPTIVIACGYSAEEQAMLHTMWRENSFLSLPLVFALEEHGAMTVRDVLSLPQGSGEGMSSFLPRAMIVAGITQKQLHLLMAAWKKLGLSSQLWAAATPVSVTWTLNGLLEELAREAGKLGLRS